MSHVCYELERFISWFCFSDRLWFDELASLWVSVQNLPSWEVVSGWMYNFFFSICTTFFFFFFNLSYLTCRHTSLQHLVNLFARLANDNIGYIDWDPYIPKVCCSFPLHITQLSTCLFLRILAHAPMFSGFVCQVYCWLSSKQTIRFLCWACFPSCIMFAYFPEVIPVSVTDKHSKNLSISR